MTSIDNQPVVSKTAATPRRWPGILGIALALLVIGVAVVAAVLPALTFASRALDDESRKIAAAVIFVASYLALAVGKVQHRPGRSGGR